MEQRSITVLIMAAGTGGHVFPALSIAERMQDQGVKVEWLGTHKGMENKILQNKNIPLHRISVSGLRGSSIKKLLLAPLMLLRALGESFGVLGKVKPDFVLGMGGFVCGPAGLACKLRGIPLFIHEQNAVAGLTNRLLAALATKVFEAFPHTFKPGRKVIFTGNPLRSAFRSASGKESNAADISRGLRLLVLGGSQGAVAINEIIPQLISRAGESLSLETWHQVGDKHIDSAEAAYKENGVSPGASHRLVPFIEDVPSALAWADIVVCRSGASTVSEIAAMGCPAIFIPYPYHKDQQQKLNAQWLVSAGAAVMVEQKDLDAQKLVDELRKLTSSPSVLEDMGRKAREVSVPDAAEKIVSACLEVVDVS